MGGGAEGMLMILSRGVKGKGPADASAVEVEDSSLMEGGRLMVSFDLFLAEGSRARPEVPTVEEG